MKTVGAPSITLEGVSKWYGEVLGLNDVSAAFGPGVSGLLGPNGAGKSTLMKLACGMLRPSLGHVAVAGEVPFGNARVMRRLGLCPEQDAVYPGVGALDTVAYLTRLQGFSRRDARQRARETLVRVGLEAAMDRSVSTYSKGMRQRFKLAQALVHDPDVLVLDEPLNGLDPPGRRELGALIAAEGREGRAVLVSSHILHEVESLCDRVLFLHTGRVLAEGTVRDIRAELPEHPLTLRITTPTPQPLALLLLDVDGVRRITFEAHGLEIVTQRPDDLLDRIAAAVDEPGVTVEGVTPSDEDLEAVFRYLTR